MDKRLFPQCYDLFLVRSLDLPSNQTVMQSCDGDLRRLGSRSSNLNLPLAQHEYASCLLYMAMQNYHHITVIRIVKEPASASDTPFHAFLPLDHAGHHLTLCRGR